MFRIARARAQGKRLLASPKSKVMTLLALDNIQKQGISAKILRLLKSAERDASRGHIAKQAARALDVINLKELTQLPRLRSPTSEWALHKVGVRSSPST